MNKPCLMCVFCDGRGCKGQIPGMGGAGDNEAFIANIESFRSVPDISVEVPPNPDFFGVKLETPVICAPMTGARENAGNVFREDEMAAILAEGCCKAGSLYLAGDGYEEYKRLCGIEAAMRSGRPYGVIFKPFEPEILFKRAACQLPGAVIAGVDIDSVNLATMTRKNASLTAPDGDILREFRHITGLPLIVKGVSSMEALDIALKAGAEAVVIGNHGGRVDASLPGTAELLRNIVPEVPDDIMIIAEGGIRCAGDVLKALRLGADFVMAGRPLLIAGYKGYFKNKSVYEGALSVSEKIRELSPEMLPENRRRRK